MIIFGGQFATTESHNGFFAYHFAKKQWEVLTKLLKPSLPALDSHTMTLDLSNDALYIFGGFQGEDYGAFINKLYKVNMTNYQVQQIKSKGKHPLPRGGHTTNLVGFQLILFGGTDGALRLNDMWSFSLENLTWSEILFAGDDMIPAVPPTSAMV
jgi:hypothetical protein